MPSHAFTDLNQGMLNVASMFVVAQVCSDLLVGKLPPEPGIPPEQKRHQHDQPRGQKKQQTLTRGHAMPRLGRFDGAVLGYHDGRLSNH